MRKHLFLFVLAIVGIAGTVFGQTPATLPYSCNFNEAGNNGWTLKNGTCVNKWYVGTPEENSDGALFVSATGNYAGYDVVAPSVVVAEKLFRTGTADSLEISFDLTVGGEDRWDYLKVFWVPADTNYEATTDNAAYYAIREYLTNVIIRENGNSYLCVTNGRKSVRIANEANSLKKLVFVWKNDDGNGDQNSVMIDNLEIRGINDLAATPVTLPYVCTFEAAGNNGWVIKNGDCTNKWNVETCYDTQSGALFVSNNGTDAGYNDRNSSVVVAEKLFQSGESDIIDISFDLTVGGEFNWDYLKVFWVPVDTNYEATTDNSIYFATSEYTTNVILGTTRNEEIYGFLCDTVGRQRVLIYNMSNHNSLMKLVFVWVNDNDGGGESSAVIDNLEIRGMDYPDFRMPASLPYTCDFEGVGYNYGDWKLKNGTCVNRWYLGKPADNQDSALFISINGDYANYDLNEPSVVVAEKLFKTGESDSLDISFYLFAGGELQYDYLKVFWVPADTNYEGSTDPNVYYAREQYYENVIMGDGAFPFLCETNERKSVRIANEPNSLKKLVFVWVNDNDGGGQSSAIIDDLEIRASSSAAIADVNAAEEMRVRIYPNPAKGRAILCLTDLKENARVIISDIQGRTVFSDSIAKGSESYKADIDGLSSGVYTVTVVSDRKKTTQKLIVE